jgi:hypothetical protein
LEPWQWFVTANFTGRGLEKEGHTTMHRTNPPLLRSFDGAINQNGEDGLDKVGMVYARDILGFRADHVTIQPNRFSARRTPEPKTTNLNPNL